MKKRIFVFFCYLLICVLLFGACSSEYQDGRSNENTSSDNLTDNLTEDAQTFLSDERKIIYKASFYLYCNEISETVVLLRSRLNPDEWFDSETIYQDSAVFIARIKSIRLDEFIANVSEGGTVENYTKTALDVSLDYNNKELRIKALQAEYERLLALIDEASLNEILTINSRLSSIEAEISQLTNAINSYNSLIEYSEVTIFLQKKYSALVDDIAYGQMILNVFFGSISALGEFFKFLLLALIAVFPFALVIAPIIIVIFFVVKWRNKKIIDKLNADKLNADQKSKE